MRTATYTMYMYDMSIKLKMFITGTMMLSSAFQLYTCSCGNHGLSHTHALRAFYNTLSHCLCRVLKKPLPVHAQVCSQQRDLWNPPAKTWYVMKTQRSAYVLLFCRLRLIFNRILSCHSFLSGEQLNVINWSSQYLHNALRFSQQNWNPQALYQCIQSCTF